MRVMDLIQRKLEDPRLVGVHLTRVDMTGDLSRATLWFRCTPGLATLDEALAGVAAATGLVRREVGRALRIRATPELVFRHDETPDQGARIEALLSRLPGAGLGNIDTSDDPEDADASHDADDAE